MYRAQCFDQWHMHVVRTENGARFPLRSGDLVEKADKYVSRHSSKEGVLKHIFDRFRFVC